MRLNTLEERFSICRAEKDAVLNVQGRFCFCARTDEELSLVCPTRLVPEGTDRRDDGWRGFRVAGELDFSLIGILARISEVLAKAEIGIFVVSTFNTDYIFVREAEFERALAALRRNGYDIQ